MNLIRFAVVAVAAADSLTIGNTRVTALSSTLLRIEPRGPKGFENRSTFNVVGRDEFSGIPIRVLNSSSSGVWLATTSYLVHVPSASAPQKQCKPQEQTDGSGCERVPEYPNGTSAPSAEACCTTCITKADCVAWVFSTSDTQCWLLGSCDGTKPHPSRIFGRVEPQVPPAIVTSLDGTILWNGSNTGPSGTVDMNLLHWPSPTTAVAYAFEDRPRFTVPPWGPTPIPPGQNVPPELVNTNGYDFTNDVEGDTYVFLLGDSLNDWWASRGEFLKLTGPTPILPDVGYGIWYTWYIQYTESRAKDEIGNWTEIGLPLDVWALDMNWREIGNGTQESVSLCRSQSYNSPGCRDHFYDYPNTDLLPGLESPANEWFSFLKDQNLSTYFNDHPFPVDNQTSPKEVAFRYKGISEWIGRGLSWFWFDHNWAFTLPGPTMPFDSQAAYEGLSGQVWGSHVYYESTKMAYQEHNIDARPITLSRDNGPNWKTAQPDTQTLSGAGSPAHHRYPVWWTGDGVPLMASVESMVNEGVHDFRPFVHSDCGGHGNKKDCPSTYNGAPPENQSCSTPNNAALLRWTAHCTLGTIIRFHQGDHRFWLRDNATQGAARLYLTMRHRLAPSLVAAGRTVQQQGFPLVARGDLFWPDHPEARDPTQYIHLNATLVAPLDVEPVDNVTNTRSVWIPPGEWTDGWTGAMVSGPQTLTVTQPPNRIPMWHMSGGFLVLDGTFGGLRIVNQDWSELTIDAFPARSSHHHKRMIYEQEGSPHAKAAPTAVEVTTDNNGRVAVTIGESPIPRSWVVRYHLRVGERFVVDDSTLRDIDGVITHLQPQCDSRDADQSPFQGGGARPPCHSGAIAEFRLSKASTKRRVEGSIQGVITVL